jgi:prephenate dehydrogenase
LENKYNLINKIDAFQNTLNEIKEALINEDVDCLERNFRKSTERREKID